VSRLNHKGNNDIERILGADQSAGIKRRLKFWIGCAAVVLLVVIAASVFHSRNTRGAVQYKTQEVQKGNLTITVTATGNLEPTNQVDVGVEVSGTIQTVAVDYNDHVQEGQVLARLDTSKLQAQVLQARAALESARTKVLKAKANVKQAQIKIRRLKRALEVSGGKVPSLTDIDAADATLQGALADEAAAKAGVSEAEATLQFHETDLSKAVIHSPVNGIVLSRHVEPGQTVAASLQTPVLFSLAEDLKEMELHVDVDEADVGRLSAGQKATFTVDAYPNRTFSAHVTEVRFSPKTVEGVVTYETLLGVDNSDLSLRPGMTATADIVVKRVKDALLIPNAALRFTPPKPTKLTEENRGLLGALLPHHPGRAPIEKREEITSEKRKRLLWTLRNGKAVAIPVTVGVTDGRMTEVLTGDVRPGLPVLTDVVISSK
jgi:HlyD family secretion protein